MTPIIALLALSLATAVITAAVMRRRERRRGQDGGPAPEPPTPPSSARTAWQAGPVSDDGSTPAVATPPSAPPRLRTVAERTLRTSRYVAASPQEAADHLRRARRGRRRSLGLSVIAGALLALMTGGFPLALWVDSRTVPEGTETTEVTVEGYRTGPTALRSGARPSARTVEVTPAVGDLESVTLEYRWRWPDAGDTLTVYPEDGLLRATNEAGTLHLVGGLAMIAFWTWATVAWAHRRRREYDERVGHWEEQAREMS